MVYYIIYLMYLVCIYLLQLGFQPMEMAGRLVQKQTRDNTKEKKKTINNTIQKHRIHKMENKNTTPKQR